MSTFTVFDHTYVYGGERHRCEERFGEAVTLSPTEREAIFIQSTAGIRHGRFDFSRDHILKTFDESLAARLIISTPCCCIAQTRWSVRGGRRAIDNLEASGKVCGGHGGQTDARRMVQPVRGCRSHRPLITRPRWVVL
ncbi:hypothetical protein GGR20_000390 [Devosia subaequoris]|uniref:Uncharacterized protein n=1 Tax=Devosia subaequoris TaxID=395930 RepID=A0A7W6NAD0_9HYPH|nr:hypothetical protein [Devosia subaequoris]MBB4050772.1 hypothetical protein [Devosia subaequoris]MCP1208548.1 hypothetical protein [Devosia subaequoris]